MSPMYPKAINVAGQPHQRTLLKIIKRDKDGVPEKVEILTDEQAVADTSEAGDLLVAYLPAKGMEGDKT